MIKIGDVINKRYKILSVLGHGGMSDVYEGFDRIFKRSVAIKVLKADFIENYENLVRFQNEARITACLNHQNIVKIYDYGEVENSPFICCEFVKSQTLKDVLDYKRFFTPKEACLIMIQLCDAIEYIHSKNVIHRDIKPQNIYYGVDGEIKLGDFGISMVVGSKLNVNENKKVSGTAQYLASEVILGKTPTFQSDIYSLGVVFFELLTGKVPFDGEKPNEITVKHVENDIPSPLSIMPNLPVEVEKIVAKSCSRDLALRYKNCNELKNDISSLLSNKKSINKGIGFFTRIFGLSTHD